MKKIKLANTGLFTLVDDIDYESLLKFRWIIDPKGYVVRQVYLGCFGGRGRGTTERIHRRIMNAQGKIQVDHINHNKLDNRRANLRLCTSAQNCQNRLNTFGASGYKGVRVHYKRWRATININRIPKHLGVFDTKEEAAHAYNQAATTYFGEFAGLNKLKEVA